MLPARGTPHWDARDVAALDIDALVDAASSLSSGAGGGTRWRQSPVGLLYDSNPDATPTAGSATSTQLKAQRHPEGASPPLAAACCAPVQSGQHLSAPRATTSQRPRFSWDSDLLGPSGSVADRLGGRPRFSWDSDLFGPSGSMADRLGGVGPPRESAPGSDPHNRHGSRAVAQAMVSLNNRVQTLQAAKDALEVENRRLREEVEAMGARHEEELIRLARRLGGVVPDGRGGFRRTPQAAPAIERERSFCVAGDAVEDEEWEM
eukprot:2774122-Prymnesium_polylepis.1